MNPRVGFERTGPSASARADRRRPALCRRGTVLALGICIGIWPISAGSASTERAREQTCGQAAGLGYCLYPGPEPLPVLLSGLGNDMRSWSPAFLEAPNRLPGVLIYDRRGYGLSAAVAPRPVTAGAAALDLAGLLQALDVSEPVILVGHSLGGLYARYFARRYPRRPAAVVLMDAASPFRADR